MSPLARSRRASLALGEPASDVFDEIRTELDRIAKSVPARGRQARYFYELTSALHSATSDTFIGELLKTMAGIDMVHVPYKSSTTAAVDLIGGRIALMFDNLTTAIPQIKAGRLRALAVTSDRRVAELPDVPTMLESGLKGFVVTPWWGIFAPAGTPKSVIDKLNRDIVGVLHSKEVREYLASQATEVVGNSPQEFAAYLKGEIARWAQVVKASGATVD